MVCRIAISFTGWMYQPMEILSLQTEDLVWCKVFRQEPQVLAGSGANSQSRDGSSLVASFCQPTALRNEGKTMFVMDTAVGAFKVVTAMNSLCRFLELLDSLCRMFGVHLRGVQAESHTIKEAISC